jgi:hypothetical protein
MQLRFGLQLPLVKVPGTRNTYAFRKPADIWALREELPLESRKRIAPETPNKVILMPINHFQAVKAEKGIAFCFSGRIGEGTALPDMGIAHIDGNPFLLTGDNFKQWLRQQPKGKFLQAVSKLGQILRKLADRTGC